jgi:hypothetical protein
MDVAIDIVDLLGQVAAVTPAISTAQPAFGALKILLQRAQVRIILNPNHVRIIELFTRIYQRTIVS